MNLFPPPGATGVRAIVFDCDGVICPPYRFAAVLASAHGITMEMTARFFRDAFSPALMGLSDVSDLLPPFLEEWGWKGSMEEFLALWLSSERDTDPQVMSLIAEAKAAGYLTALATNQESRRASYLRNEMGLEGAFDHCFISCEMGSMKPQAEFFDRASAELALDPGNILFLDDQEHYLAAARLRGWRTIRFLDASSAREGIADALAAPVG